MRLTLNKFAYWALLAWGSVNALRLASAQLPLLSLRESIGYGDAYILDSGPLLYGMLALAQIAIPSENPYLGPRLLELFWFFACAAHMNSSRTATRGA